MSFFTPDQLAELDTNWIRRDGGNTATGEILFETGLKTPSVKDDGNGAINIQATGDIGIQSVNTTVEGSVSVWINSEGELKLKGDESIKHESPFVEFPEKVYMKNNDGKILALNSMELTDDREQKFPDQYGTIVTI